MLLAWSEIRRAKTRFIALAVAVGLLVFLVLFQQGLRDGLITQFIGAIRNQNAPVLVYGEQARRNLEGSQVRPDQEVAVAAVAGVARVGRLGEGTFTVSTPTTRAESDARDRLTDAVIFGFEIDGDAAGLGAPTTVIAGRLPTAPREAVASARNRAEGFDIGDVVRVEPDGVAITVVGLATDINYSVAPTLFTAWGTYEDARRTRNPDAVEVFPTVLVVELDAAADVAEVLARLSAIDGVEALTRQQAEDASPGVAAVSQSLNTVIGLLLLTALLVIGLFVLIITVHKAAALTLLRAIGARRSTLVRALLIQTTMVVGAGVVIGGALLAVVAPAASDIGVAFRLRQVAGMGVVTVSLSLVASWAAVRRVLRIDPLSATTTQGSMR
jgi:putative ABC transport system permease protein